MLAGRIVSPERKLLLKDVSAESAHTATQRPLLSFEEPYALDIDNTALSAEEVAARVVAAARALR